MSVFKNGWHPKGKDGGKEGWRSDFKGVNTVAGWMGKGKDPNAAAHEHVSAPLSTLKDPASFGPPPKHVKYYGAEAASASASPSSTPADTGWLGSPVQGSARQRLQDAQNVRAGGEEANKPPPGTYQADTTGLRTQHLPKPPPFRPVQGAAGAGPAAVPAKPKPKLPPRLPPRQNTHPDANIPSPPPPYTESTQDHSPAEGHLNQGALNRLGQAGVSVPGFNIGRTASPPVPPRQSSSPGPVSPTAEGSRGPQLSELQSRFSKMSTSSSNAPSTGTTWAEKQAALKTASNLRNDPSKVSLSDVRGAASTANNFRERHGEQAAAGWRAASNLNQKYGIANKVSSFASPSTTPPPPQSPTQAAAGKKPPPPPPPKRRDVGSPSEPPPIPLGSKPKF